MREGRLTRHNAGEKNMVCKSSIKHTTGRERGEKHPGWKRCMWGGGGGTHSPDHWRKRWNKAVRAITIAGDRQKKGCQRKII